MRAQTSTTAIHYISIGCCCYAVLISFSFMLPSYLFGESAARSHSCRVTSVLTTRLNQYRHQLTVATSRQNYTKHLAEKIHEVHTAVSFVQHRVLRYSSHRTASASAGKLPLRLLSASFSSSLLFFSSALQTGYCYTRIVGKERGQGAGGGYSTTQ